MDKIRPNCDLEVPYRDKVCIHCGLDFEKIVKKPEIKPEPKTKPKPEPVNETAKPKEEKKTTGDTKTPD